MTESLRAGILHRKIHQEFIARGIFSKEEAQDTGEFFSAAEVTEELSNMLLCAEAKINK